MTMEQTKAKRGWKAAGASAGRAGSARRKFGTTSEFAEAFPEHPGRRMSEKEFLGWVKERTRAEWTEGEVTIMSPVSVDHDELQNWFVRLLGDFVEERGAGKVCGSELYVRLPRPAGLRLPDLFFVSTAALGGFERNAFVGAPDLIVEIVSRDSIHRDYVEKLSHYESSGVKEYWIVDPLSQRVTVWELNRGRYRAIAEKGAAVHSRVLKGFFVRPGTLWRRPLPSVAGALREMGSK